MIPIETCKNTDNGAKDNDGDGCDEYAKNPKAYCGNSNNDHFDSNEMCCACGGGTPIGNLWQRLINLLVNI